MLNAHGVPRPVVVLTLAVLALTIPAAHGQGKSKLDEAAEQMDAAAQAGDWVRMEKLADACLELETGRREGFWGCKGLAILNQGRAAEAEPWLKKALEGNPQWVAIWDQLGKAQRLQGKLDDALASGRKAVALDPTYARSYENLGLAYSDKGMSTEAIMSLEKALELEPKLTDSATNLGYLYNKAKRYDETIQMLTKFIGLSPGCAVAHYQLGNAYLYKRDFKAAIPQYEQALKIRPGLAAAMEMMARSYQALGDTENAIRCYESLCTLQPDNKKALAELAKLRAKGDAPPAADPPAVPPASDSASATTPPPAASAGGGAVMPVQYKNKLGTGSDSGYINASGTLVVQGLMRARHFSEGLAEAVPIVQGSFDEIYGYIDPAGTFVVKPQFSGATPFHCGLAAVQPKGQYKWGYADRSGNMVIPAQYEQADPFSCDIGRVNTGDGYRYIDKSGKFLFEDKPFKGRGDTFSDGLASTTLPMTQEERERSRIGKKAVYIDITGKIVIEKEFQTCGRFSEGLAFVILYDGGNEKRGYIDKTGRLVLDLTGKIGYGRPFSDGMAGVSAVNDSDKWGYIDLTGKIVVEPKYRKHSDNFHEGLACVVEFRDDFYTGYIDKTGAVVIPMEKGGGTSVYGELDWIFCSHSGSFRNGLASHNGKIKDRSGKVVWPK